MAGYVVTAPLALVKDSNGKIQYLYTNATVPDGTPRAEVERLAQRGLIGKVAPSASTEPASDAGGSDVPRPAQVASKGAWVDYAVSRGMSREKAEAASKTELIDAYPGE